VRQQAAGGYPSGLVCEECGRQPAALVRFRSIKSWFVFFTYTRYDSNRCRPCGIRLFREVQNQTMLGGWWGITLLFNPVVIGRNLWERRKLERLSNQGASPYGIPPSLPPDAGRPLWRRAGIWVTAAFVLFALVAYGNGDFDDIASRGTLVADRQPCGNIVGDKIYEVPCDDPAAELRKVKVLAPGADPERHCPDGTEWWTETSADIVCWASM
jgi:hypothetical protein